MTDNARRCQGKQFNIRRTLRNWQGYRRLAWIDETHGQHSQRGNAWEKEVISASQFDEIRQVAADERRVGCACVSLHRELAASAVVAHQYVFVVPQMRVVAVFDPLLLYELKLARDAGIESHKDNAALLCVGGGLALGDELSVWKTAPGNAAAIDQPAIESEGITRMDAPDVRSHRTACALGIGAIGDVRAAVRILCD